MEETKKTDPNEIVLDMKEYQVRHCTWSLEKHGLKNPHIIESPMPHKKIYNNVLELIGNSPLVRLNNIPKSFGIKCELLAKCEFMLPGGSVKDRIGRRMVEDAEKKGLLTPGKSTLIEATSGNTGIGLTLTAAVKGYPIIITLPDKMSQEKNDIMLALGADVVRTPTSARTDGPDSHIGLAIKLRDKIEGAVILDQYVNPGNACAHYDHTGYEIWDQCDGKIDYVVLATGTGGTMTGVARKLKELNKDIIIVGVDPLGSILAHKDNMEHPDNVKLSYKVEGTGYDFFPKVFDYDVVDEWKKSNDKESFRMARRLIREEGLFVGGSSGSAMQAAIEVCQYLPADKRVVVLFADGVRNYMTKFLNNDYMLENGFYDIDEYDNLVTSKYQEDKTIGKDKKIAELKLPEVTGLLLENTLSECYDSFNKQKVEFLPVVNDKNEVIGTYNLRLLTIHLTSGKFNKKSELKDCYVKECFKVLTQNDFISRLSRSFSRHQYVVVTGTNKLFVAESKNLMDYYMAN